ncbi:mechanosensitive ion channel family protein [Terriglobus roseus]|uniref:Mechanosensitive ion channel n=1 Tax=Terriglobus roseus TaxID=392734 RepID=A0A1G7PYV7_9BACT|nr:mechanosensitive ion channel domain-containing protein [Terriglobus roseus]SDF90550.1 Mechanosensitive ion channel [Terriglobus roseus]
MRLKGSGRLLLLAVGVTACLVAARLVLEGHHLPDFVYRWGGSLQGVLATELFSVGNSPVRLLFVIKVAVFFFVLSRFTRVARWILKGLLQSDPRFDNHRIYVLSRLLTITIFVIGCLLGIHVEHINLHTFVLVGGTIGVAVGLGVQRYVGNLVSGLSILFEGQLRLGDFVQFGDQQGFIERLGATSSQIRTPNNTTVVIPNTELSNSKFINYSGRHTTFRLVLPLTVSYGVDAEIVLSEVMKTIAAHPAALERPEPSVILTEMKPDTMNFQARLWTKTHPEDFDVLTSELYVAIKRMFEANGITLPRPAMDVWLAGNDGSENSPRA